MKRLLLIVLSVLMIASLYAGCTPTPTTPSASASTSTSPSTSVASPAASTSASVSTSASTSASASAASPAAAIPIKIGHLTYHTGPFGHVGNEFDMAANFAVSLINENPPLGGPVTLVHQDLGTIGEGEAAKVLLEKDKVDVLLNVAGEYQSYRQWLLDYIKDNGKPLLPSVHAGSQKSTFGGTYEEPIFRGAPQDPDQGIAAVQFLADKGIKSAVVLAVENDGMQLMQTAAVGACKQLGINMLGEFDFPAEQNSYRSLASKVQALNPEAVVCFCAGTDGGTIVKNAAEVGMSTVFVSGTDWLDKQVSIAMGESAIKQHKGIYCVGFTYVEGEAWNYYTQQWKAKADITGTFDPAYSYSLQFYDLLNVAMLAVKKSGSLDLKGWVDAMRTVSAPGAGKTKVYNYKQGFEALSKGLDIDYDGVTGVFEYSPTGVVSGNFGVYQWNGVDNRVLLSNVDGAKVLKLSTAVGVS